MTTATISNSRRVTAQKVRFHGHWLTRDQIQAYLDASSKKRAKLVVQYKQRGPFLTDQDFDDLTADLAMWRERWLRRISR